MCLDKVLSQTTLAGRVSVGNALSFTGASRARCTRSPGRAGTAAAWPGGGGSCRTVGGASSPASYLRGMAAQS